MSVFDRITKFITPPPKRKAEPETPPPQTFQPREDSCAAALKPLIPELLSQQDEFSPEVQEAVAELETIARTYGPYKTAVTLQQMVTELRDRSDEPEYNRRRGYSFAGDLYLIHLKQCIAAIKSKPMGPRVFQEYFVEILDCYHLANHSIKAVEASIRVAEKLWSMAIEVTDHNETYLQFADRCMQTATQVCAQKLEQDRLAAHREKRHARTGLTPGPTRVLPKEAMNPALLDHLTQVKEALERGRAAHKEILVSFAELPADPHARSQRLWELVRHINYAGLAGPIVELMAEILGAARITPEAQKMVLTTAKACEGVVASEMRVGLGGIARSHIALALRLYRLGGDAQNAQRVEQMLKR